MDQAPSRLVVRICAEYFLDAASVLSEIFGGDLTTGLVFLAITRENMRGLDHGSAEAQLYGGADTPPPDELRAPVTVYTISINLGLTYETARRHVNRLIKDGFCKRVDGGLVVSNEVLGRSDMARGRDRNVALFRRLMHDAARAGLIGAPL